MLKARIETALAVVAAALAVVTFIWPIWIETVFSVDPDGGDGTAEWWGGGPVRPCRGDGGDARPPGLPQGPRYGGRRQLTLSFRAPSRAGGDTVQDAGYRGRTAARLALEPRRLALQAGAFGPRRPSPAAPARPASPSRTSRTPYLDNIQVTSESDDEVTV
jgi:hypothetical protein